MYKTIAAFGAHPDDLEIGCYGTLSKFLKMGSSIHLFITTGTEERIAESTASAAHLESERCFVHPLGYNNNEVPYNKEIIQDIDCRLETINPDLVITHWVNDNQQDHQNIARSVISACRKRDNIWMMQPPPGRPPISGNFRPQVYVDISGEELIKKNAILEHKSQYERLDMKSGFDPWSARDNLNGLSIKATSAEVFEIVKQTVRI